MVVSQSIPTVQIRSGLILQYEDFGGRSRRRNLLNFNKHEVEQESDDNKYNVNKEKNKTKAVLSPNSIRKLKFAINLLNSIAETKRIIQPLPLHPITFKLNFITLTLPSPQGDFSDADFKNILLNRFFKAAKRKFKLKNYIWKVEAQKNGNIHCHITTDCYMYHNDLRNEWNNILSRFGFIDQYRINQLAWHSNGFKSRPELFKKWPLEKQIKAYNFGMRTDWQVPNTSDIHKVEKIENLAAYIVKYMCKTEKGKRAIKGKLWGCSENLTYNNRCISTSDYVIEKEIRVLQKFPTSKKVTKDYCALTIFPPDSLDEITTPTLYRIWQGYLRVVRGAT